jgi:quinoprotein glucose dehydrogenase
MYVRKVAKPPRSLGVLLIALGVLLIGGGVWLLTKGASPYFLVVGLGIAVSGILLMQGRKAALIVYGLTLAVIIAGSFLEEGMNVSKLVPRMAIPLIIAFYLSQEKVRATLT